MHDLNLKMVKIMLVIVAIAIFFGILGGISLLRSNYYARAKYFQMQFDYVREKVAYEEYSYGSLPGWIGSWTSASRRGSSLMRHAKIKKREVNEDKLYQSKLVTKFINRMMRDGKKSVAEKSFYGCLDLLAKDGDPVQIFETAIFNVGDD